MKTLSKEAIGVGVALIVVLTLLVFKNPISNKVNLSSDVPNLAGVGAELPGALLVEDQLIGEGDEAVAGKIVGVTYTGKFENGTTFDSNVGSPAFEFTLGSGQVIPGFDKGVLGMKIGGKRVITVPPSEGYGENQVGPIPANSTLVFEIELISVK